MKKLLATLAIFATFITSALAQTNKNEISIMYGAGSIPQIANFLGDGFTGGSADFSYSGNFTVQYLGFVSKSVALGGSFGYERCSSDKNSALSCNYFNIMGNAKFMWFNKEHVGMYSRLGLGVSFEDASSSSTYKNDDETRLAFQASAVGVEFGGENLRGFVETGLGFQGIFVAGIHYGF